MIKYEEACDIKEKVHDLVSTLDMKHIRMESIYCMRSRGSASRGTVARCHGLSKAMQMALGRGGFYVLEFISERFDRLSEDEQWKTIIHEVLHIPQSFGGGFKHHDFVNNKNINRFFESYKSLKAKKRFIIDDFKSSS